MVHHEGVVRALVVNRGAINVLAADQGTTYGFDRKQKADLWLVIDAPCRTRQLSLRDTEKDDLVSSSQSNLRVWWWFSIHQGSLTGTTGIY